ncbi:MAG TPA: hypothetical protein PK156_45430, partial [Polyangium sp.]|nr:hypothetical protein [Polyangium sp.]
MLHLVLLAANPLDQTRLRLGAEAREIHNALETTMGADAFRLDQSFAVRPRDLQGLLLRHKPQIVHFSGHGQGSAHPAQATTRTSREMLHENDDGYASPANTCLV